MGAVQKGSPNLQVKLENEKEIFHPDYKLPESPESSLPYRKIWDVSFYNSKVCSCETNLVLIVMFRLNWCRLVKLQSQVHSSGLPVQKNLKVQYFCYFSIIRICIVGIKEHYNNRNYKISLHPVLEYSLELPYGRKALVWVTTETACYRIMSISSSYISFWQSFYEKVCFSGHVVNILLNYRGPLLLVKLIIKVSKLSSKSADETYESLRTHRKFIQELLKDQNLSARIRKEYNTLQSNQAIWELNWDAHLANAEKRPEKFGKLNILSFFRPKSSDENSIESVNSCSASKKSSNTLDETSSLLSISEDDSAIYIESAYELADELEKSTESGIQTYFNSSFTSAQFLEWKLLECESFNESFYNCPICKVTFRTKERECLSAFTIHLRAHQADCNLINSIEKVDEYSVNDFESRFNYFRNDLKDLISGKSSYIKIPMVYDKNVSEFSPQLIEKPFKHFPLLDYEEFDRSSIALNPIKALKFNPNMISSNAPLPARPAVSSPVVYTPAPSATVPTPTVAPAAKAPPKKSRAKKTTRDNPATSAALQVSVPSPSVLTSAVTTIAAAESKLECLSVDSFRLHVIAQSLLDTNVSLGQLTPRVKIDSLDQVNLPTAQISGPSSQSTNVASVSATSASSTQSQIASASAAAAMTTTPLIPSQSEASKSAQPLEPRKFCLDNAKDFETVSHSSPGFKRSLSPVPVPIDFLPSEDLNSPPIPSFTDMASSYSMDGKEFGCFHYKVNCKFYAECCKRWFTCRFCHDECSDHRMNRHETKFCLCMFCGTSQKAARCCSNPKCRSVMAHYFCDKCKFWDNDPSKLIYHCEKCGICRTGSKSNYEHCNKCIKCVAKSAFSSHQCETNSTKMDISPSADVGLISAQTDVDEVSMKPTTQSNVNGNYLKIVLNTSSINPPVEKRAKVDVPFPSTPYGNISSPPFSIMPFPSPVLVHKGFTDYLAQIPSNRLPSQERRKCWNCSNVLPSNPDGSFQSKYCTHCSAIVE